MTPEPNCLLRFIVAVGHPNYDKWYRGYLPVAEIPNAMRFGKCRLLDDREVQHLVIGGEPPPTPAPINSMDGEAVEIQERVLAQPGRGGRAARHNQPTKIAMAEGPDEE